MDGDSSIRPQESVPGRLLDVLVETSDLSEVLATVTELALDTVPGCESASVTVVRDREPATLASSDRRAKAVDDAQYAANDGPCLRAARSDDMVKVDDVSTCDIPGEWQRVALTSGIEATLSMPIASEANISAGLNLYTSHPHGWPDEAVDAADLLAAYAGDAITLAYRLNQAAEAAGDTDERRYGSVLPFGRS